MISHSPVLGRQKTDTQRPLSFLETHTLSSVKRKSRIQPASMNYENLVYYKRLQTFKHVNVTKGRDQRYTLRAASQPRGLLRVTVETDFTE